MKYRVNDLITLEQALDFSLELAAMGQGLVEPNPCVGSVLVDESNSKLISFGYHKGFGGPHAEVECLKSVGSAEGLTLIVSLEPCSHHGKTPSCADLVIEKEIKKLIYITRDPNPLVSGKGLLKIKQVGIEVVQADKKYFDRNRKLNHKFFYSFENEKSYIHLKWAESADGKMVVKEGSPWITNRESQEHSQFLRAQSQAVLIGKGTLEIDNPSLNVRKEGYEKTLKVIIFDPELENLSTVYDKNICKVRDEKDIIFLCREIPENNDDYSFLKLHKNFEGEWNLNRLVRDLYAVYGFQSVFVEGGAYTISQFIKQNVYNRVSIFRAPHELGSRGNSSVAGFSRDKVKNFISQDDEDMSGDLFEDFFYN